MRKNLFLFLSIIIILSVIISATGCSNKSTDKTKPATAKHSDVKGLLWRIKGKNSTIYLYASFHTMKSDMLPFGKTIENAYNKSDNLVVECNTSNTAELKKYQTKMFYEGNDNIYNHLSSAGKVKIDSFAKELNLNMNNLKRYKSSYIYSQLLLTQLLKMGFSYKGVDTYFMEKAIKQGKKILELESIEKQYDIVGGIPDSEFEQQYITDVDNMNEEGKLEEKVYKAYVAGDEKALVKLTVEPAKKYPVTYKNMIVDRNVQMADKIENYLNTKDTYFIIAGAGHYVGSDSVIKILIKKGFKVQRVH